MTENGMPAIRASRVFEIDVRTNASGALVVMHDPTVGRTTNGTGRVAKKTSKQIRALRLDDGSRIPFISTVFTHLRNHPKKHAVLHVKSVAGSKLINRARSYGVMSQVAFISVNRADLDATGHARTVFVSSSPMDPADYSAYDGSSEFRWG